VEFVLYRDTQGLGAQDVCKAPAAPATKGSIATFTSDSEPPLPVGWEKHWSEEDEEYYYWNKVTKASSWTHPNEKDEGELPLGWTKEFDEARGEHYYWHKSSRTAQWEKPEAGNSELTSGRDAPEDAAAAAKAAKAPVLGLQRREGIVTSWQIFFGWIAPLGDMSVDLKPLLDKTGKIYVNWREVKGGGKLQVGAHVNFSLCADDTGVSATDVCLHSEDDRATNAAAEAMDALEQQWAEQDGEAAEKVAADAAGFGVGELTANEGGALLPGWEEIWSEEHRCPYYWHQAAQQSSWERPAIPDDGADTTAESRSLPKARDNAQAKTATPLTPLISKPGRCMTPITPTITKVKNSGNANSQPIPAWQPPSKRARAQ